MSKSFKQHYLNEKASTKADAYFISPSGKIKIVNDRHIHEIYNNPDKFGITKEEIDKIYKKWKEPPFTEGNAREEIIKKLLANGWIRIRKYQNFWSINVNKLGTRQKEYLYDWANEMIGNGESKYDTINIDTPVGNDKMDMIDIARYKFNESILPKIRKYILEWVTKF